MEQGVSLRLKNIDHVLSARIGGFILLSFAWFEK